MRRRSISRLVVSVLALSAASFGVLSLYATVRAYRSRADAERLMVELRSLKVGESLVSDVNGVAGHHIEYRRSFLKPTQPACSTNNDPCFFDFTYDNSLLASLHLAQSVRFGVRVQMDHQRVGVIMIDLICGEGPDATSVYLNEGIQPFTDRTIEVSNVSNARHGAWVLLTPNSPQRSQAYSLSLSALDHLGGCPDKNELLASMGAGLSR